MADSKKINYGTSKYNTLCYAKMVGKPFTNQDVRSCLAGTWRQASTGNLGRALRELVRSGHLSHANGFYKITEAGIDEIYSSANRRRMSKDNRVGRVRSKLAISSPLDDDIEDLVDL